MQVLTIDFHAHDAHQQFLHSLKETGFAVLSNHPLDNTLLKSVHDEWREFYNQGLQKKYPWINKTQEGYAPFRMENAKDNPHQNLMEFYNVFPWGIYPDETSGAALKLYNKLSRIAITLLSWLDEELPQHVSDKLSMPLAKMIETSARHLMRVIHYPPLKGDEHPQEIRAAEHFDSNLITILPAPSEPGLQLKLANGEWIDVDYHSGDIVINTGAMMEVCTEGYLAPTAHRVINPQGSAARKERMSTPIFIHPRDEVKLSKNLTAKQYADDYLRANGVLD